MGFALLEWCFKEFMGYMKFRLVLFWNYPANPAIEFINSLPKGTN